MQRKGYLGLAIALLLTLSAPVQAATPKAGAKCTKAGATFDDYYKNSKGFDSAVEKWMKTPTLKVVNFALTFESDEI